MPAFPLVYDRCKSCGRQYAVTPKCHREDPDHHCQRCLDRRRTFKVGQRVRLTVGGDYEALHGEVEFTGTDSVGRCRIGVRVNEPPYLVWASPWRVSADEEG